MKKLNVDSLYLARNIQRRVLDVMQLMNLTQLTLKTKDHVLHDVVLGALDILENDIATRKIKVLTFGRDKRGFAFTLALDEDTVKSTNQVSLNAAAFVALFPDNLSEYLGCLLDV